MKHAESALMCGLAAEIIRNPIFYAAIERERSQSGNKRTEMPMSNRRHRKPSLGPGNGSATSFQHT